MTLFLGIDGGGTRTSFLLVDDSDREIAALKTGPSNCVSVGPEASRQAIEAGIRQLPAPPDVVGAGFAGAGRSDIRRHYEKVLRNLLPTSRIFAETDAFIAYIGAIGARPGLLLIAGTGSIVVGRRADGTMFRRGGWGPHFGDEGSGFWIGREAIREALRARDCGPSDEFPRRIAVWLGLRSIEELVEAWASGRIGVPDVASLAEPVLADYPSQPAREIIERAAVELRRMVDDAAASVGSSDIHLSASGSIATHPRIQQLVGLRFTPPAYPPERGAILWAREQLAARDALP